MRISTIIPTYNRARRVSQALDSALAQSFPADQHEIIVVDDGSTDDTREVVAAYGSRVRYLYKQNGGVSSARNLGCREATGDLIAFLDSDDVWLPTKLEKQERLLAERPDLGMVVTDVTLRSEKGGLAETFHRREEIPVDGPVLATVLYRPRLIPSSVLLRRSIFEAVGGFDESLACAEDIDLNLRVASVAGIGVIAETLTICAALAHGLSDSISSYEPYVKVIERFVEEHPDLPPRVRTDALALAYAKNARGLFSMGEYRMGLQYALAGVRHVRGSSGARAYAAAAMMLVRSTGSRLAKRLGLRPAV